MDLNTVQLLAIEYAIAVMGLFLGYKCFFLKKENMNRFMHFVIVLNAFALVNIPIRYVELHVVSWNRTFVFWLYAASVILMTYTMVFWFLFVLIQIDSCLVKTKLRTFLCFIPSFGIIPLCILNYWTGWLYVIDESSWYARGSVFVLQSVISYGYFLVFIICNVLHLIFCKEKDGAVRKCFLSTIPAIVGTVLQIVFGGSYLLLGTMFGAWIMYIEICLDRQKAYEFSDAIRAINEELKHSNNEIADNMRTILALSDIYYILYEVDLEKDTFTEIKAPEVVSEFCSQFSSAKECMKNLPGEMFAAAYVGLMGTFFDPESIQECLEHADSYFVDGIGKFSKDWIRATVISVERDDEGKVVRFVFTFQKIGEIIEQQKKVEEAKIYEIHAQEMKELFIQTAEALASAIDAKDKYTHGHSVRVASYSKKIAELAGLSESECEKVYFAGLLHDVGKIGIRDHIICKEGKLTSDEYDEIKKHPSSGKDILDRISRLPYLSIGANCHHERYDGKGYPVGLKGEEIPEMARIIAVADAYDAMTSKRSYRNPIPQQMVREEIIKGMETQFDPTFAKIMIHLIDMDFEYQMKEAIDISDGENQNDIICEAYRSTCTQGIRINENRLHIHLCYESNDDDEKSVPAFVFFDSLDALIHDGDGFEEELFYYEYGELKADGTFSFDGVRKTQFESMEKTDQETVSKNECDIEIVKYEDHMCFEMKSGGHSRKATLALPDSTRFAYVSITGENCHIYDIDIKRDKNTVEEGDINRIAEKITYLSGVDGDIPSIQIDGWRSAATTGILLDRKKEITFDMKSLPFARLLWHCPFFVIYHSDDGQIYGDNYKEYGLIRLDGESWAESEHSTNHSIVNKNKSFEGWEQWKKDNIKGRSCSALVQIDDNQVKIITINGGIEIENETIINEEVDDIYIAITGDQCVVENIKIINI